MCNIGIAVISVYRATPPLSIMRNALILSHPERRHGITEVIQPVQSALRHGRTGVRCSSRRSQCTKPAGQDIQIAKLQMPHPSPSYP